MTEASPSIEHVPSELTGDSPPVKKSKFSLYQLIKKCLLSLLGMMGIYFVIILIGLFPVNNNFQETPGGIEIYITSNNVHADLILPIRNEIIDWSQYFPAENFQGNITHASHVAIGWGDKGFYLNTPTWAELKMSTALNALFLPSSTCLHVAMCGQPEINQHTRKLTISQDQYQKMVSRMVDYFKLDAKQSFIAIKGRHYHDYDSFYEAHGLYHCLFTCNSWVGYMMRISEIRTPLLTPFPKSMFLYLPQTSTTPP